LSGVLFFSDYAWKGWGAWGYSLAYNLSQNVPLCLLSGVIVLLMPLGAMRRSVRKLCAE
jgi:thiamine transporter